MKKKSPLASAWNLNIKPILLPFLLVCVALIMVSSDSEELQGVFDDWSSLGNLLAAIGKAFVIIVRDYWFVLLLVIGPIIAAGFIERRVASNYHKRLKTLRITVMIVVITGIVAYFGYQMYSRHEYVRLTWLLILYVVNIIISFFIKESQPEQ